MAAAYCCLLINGFVGFQFAEDGTPLSLWVRSSPSGCSNRKKLNHLMFLICVFTLFSYCVSLVLSFLLLASSLQLRHSNNLRDSNTLNLLVYLLPIFFGRSSALLCISFRNSFLSSGPLRIAGQSVTSSLVPPSLSSPRSSYLHFP